MPIIDNENQTMQDALINALPTSDRVDILVGYFYFSGFQALAEHIKDKKVRILVGLEVDPDLIPEMSQYAREADSDLSRWQPRVQTYSKTTLKHNYIESFVGFMNDSDIFDDDKSSQIFDLYLEKIENGTLEIRKTTTDEHGKFYLLYNKNELSQNGDFPGTVFMGSSNLTYNGLRGQGELNEASRDGAKFKEYQRKFESLWDDSKSVGIADTATKNEFVEKIKPRIWKYQIPSPHEIYIRVLHEIFYREETEKIKTPSAITGGKFSDFEYQVDAVKMVMDKLNRYDGAILADVVGLGKSIIASAVARNMDMRTVIIAPPHLISQWEDYKEEFGIRGSKVYSSGKIGDVYEKYQESREPILIILDEAHRYRNEDTTDYKYLHQVCRSNPGNKVLLLTATPFNNDPKDVFALIKLFQTPGLSTIKSVDNLSMRYRELIQRYKTLRRDMTKGLAQPDIDRESEIIASEQRRLIEPIIIRRSRLDLKFITRYREDLERQNIHFAEIKGPELLQYDLGGLFDLYTLTLNTITGTDNAGFIGARYKPTVYMNEENRKEFISQYKKDFDDIEDLQVAQTNLSKFMRRLLVMRFESSKDAFRSTLDKMIKSNEIIESWWDKLGAIPIMKKGQLPDPSEFEEEDGSISDGLAEELEQLKEHKGFIEIKKELLEPNFISDVRNDTKLLKGIYSTWFDDPHVSKLDPKLDELSNRLKGFLEENNKRKIILFSAYKDTVDYLYDELYKRGFTRVAKYTASEGNDSYKQVIKANFDASYDSERQVDDYDILLATDALSEGFNLHRAGIVINYDIPYNPTRVIQRVGRINRINKKVFDYLYVYNCFPTVIGEEEVRIRSISTLKIKLINAVVGSDTKTLTDDEQLVSFFKDEFTRAQSENEQLSWDTKHREVYEQALRNKDILEKSINIPRRSRVKRIDTNKNSVLVFGKKGSNAIFAKNTNSGLPEIVSTEIALPYFEAKSEEKGFAVDADFTNIFNVAKDKLFAKHELPSIQGRRAEAIKVLKLISNERPLSKDYCEDIISIIKTLDDISEGTLKDIAQLKLQDIEKAFSRLMEIVPEVYIRNIQNRAQKADSEHELLLFAEQLQ